VAIPSTRSLSADRLLFWGGVALILAGAAQHLAHFLSMSEMRYALSGEPMDIRMVLAMVALAVGVSAAAASLLLPRPYPNRTGPIAPEHVRSSRFRPAHARMFAVLSLALVIDVMKPATLGFVLPGMGVEYGIGIDQQRLLPLVALTGTAVGSVVWGVLADRSGRRPVVILATLLFVATAVCGAMPSFEWNLVMCFFMGTSAGGFLPIAFVLVAELFPARQAGWAAVVLGTLGGVGGYAAASLSAALLEPIFTWRALWLVGLPTGLLLLALVRFLPESPSFLLRGGRADELDVVAHDYALEVITREEPTTDVAAAAGPGALHAGLILSFVAVSWGIVNFGLLTWLPTLMNLGAEGTRILASASLIALPAGLVAAVAYSRRRTTTLIVATFATAAALVALATSSPLGTFGSLPSLVVLLAGLGAMSASLMPFSAEAFRHHVRGRGTGSVAGAMKLGGVVGPQLVATTLTLGFGPSAIAALCAAFVVASAVALLVARRSLRVTDLARIPA